MKAPPFDSAVERHLAVVAGHPVRTGGMQTFCRFLVDRALSAGWRVTVALSGENIHDSVAPEHRARLTVDPVEWLDRTLAGDRDYRWSLIRRRRDWFKQVRPDVAVFVQSSNTPLRASIVGAWLAGVPIVSTHRTMAWPLEVVPSRRHFFGLVSGLRLHQRKVRFKTRLTAALADRIVCNSQEVRDGYERIYGYPARKSSVIVNAVQVPGRSAPRNRANAEVRIGFVGRIGSDKRLDVLLRAVAAMRTAIPVRVALHGEGDEELNLRALANDLGITDRVEFRGVATDVWAAYAAMDIVVLCSPRESSSNMVLEAMATGKAIVVTRAGGSPELVDQGQCGLCVPPLDVGLLATVLGRLAANPELRCQLGRRARERALACHDPAAVGQHWIDLLTEVADRRNSFRNRFRVSASPCPRVPALEGLS